MNPQLGKSINLDAFRPLVEIARQSGVRRFIYASSSSVYGIKQVPDVTEDMTLEPLTDYSKYKAMCEEILAEYQGDGFTTVTLRPATVCGYSPRQRLDVVVNILTNLAYHTGTLKVLGGDQLRPNLHIQDMADAYLLMLEAPAEKIAGKTFNVGYENRTVRQLAEMVRGVIGEDTVRMVTLPSNDNRSYHVSSAKIARELGFVPKHRIEEAVGDLVHAFEAGLLDDPMNNPLYYNIKRMQEIGLKSSAAPRIPYINLASQHRAVKAELLEAARRVLDSGGFILGPEVEAFEREFAAYCHTQYAVGVDNGTSALSLTMRALGIGPGDEVITAPNSFLASASSIALVGARPVFVDVRDDYNIDPNKLEAAVGPRTRAIMPVHLTGRPADMDPILEIARRRGLHVIEDAAQAVGAEYRGRRVGSFGAAGCFSLHPLKNLNAIGDGGMITTGDPQLYEQLKKARNHGLRNRDECEFWSPNCRLDALQAAMLRVKMKYLDGWTAARREHAAFYQAALREVVRVPEDKPYERAVCHTFIIQTGRRDELQRFLLERGIETKIHYPIPIHLQPAAAALGYGPGSFPVAEQQAHSVLSLPVYPELTPAERSRVVEAIRGFYQ